MDTHTHIHKSIAICQHISRCCGGIKMAKKKKKSRTQSFLFLFYHSLVTFFFKEMPIYPKRSIQNFQICRIHSTLQFSKKRKSVTDRYQVVQNAAKISMPLSTQCDSLATDCYTVHSICLIYLLFIVLVGTELFSNSFP